MLVREGSYGTQVIAVEPGGAEFIPLNERHGRPIRLFWTWTSPNMEFATIIVGVLAVAGFGLNMLLRRNPDETLLFATRRTNWAGPVAMLTGMGISIWLFCNQTEYVGVVPTHFPGVGDITFIVGFLITAAVYLGWHLLAGTGREKTLAG